MMSGETSQPPPLIPSVPPRYRFRRDALRKAWWFGLPPLVYAAFFSAIIIAIGHHLSGSIEAWWVPGCLGAGLMLSEILFLPWRLAAREHAEHAFIKTKARIAQQYKVSLDAVPEEEWWTEIHHR